MVAIQTISAGAFSISLPFLPLFIQTLGVHPLSNVEEWAGIIGSANFLTAALCAPLWGALADKFGRRAMVIRSSVGGAIATALMGLSGNVWQLVGARGVMGAFGGFSSAATALVASKVPSSSLGFALGWMATAQMTGIMIGPIIGGAIADYTQNYRAVFFWSAGGVALAALVTTLFVQEDFQKKPATGTEKLPSSRQQFMEMVRHPELAALLVQNMVGASPYLATFAGAAFAVTGVGDLVASPFLGKRSDQIGYRRIVLLCLVWAGVFTIPQAFVHNIWVFLALRFGVGVFLGGIVPTANAWIGRLFPAEKRGMVYGLSYSASFGGMFIGPLFGGFLAARLGFGSVFLVTGGLMLANVFWVLFGVRPAEAARDWR
jgi:DHA1 family multidrug resistance protein-like MFS transporter